LFRNSTLWKYASIIFSIVEIQNLKYNNILYFKIV
jgi:hypothetical protein